MRLGNRGQVLVVFLAALVGLLGVAALAVDAGYMYTVRHELQRCTDAGALAGASAFFNGDWVDPSIQALADVRARDYACRDKVLAKRLNPGDLAVGFPGPDRVRVDASRTVDLFFARMFLGPTRTISASSTASAAVISRNIRNLKPWAIPYPWEDLNGNGLYDPGEPIHRDCPEGVADPSRYFCPGTQVILKIGVPQNSPKNPDGLPSLQQEPGHFFALDFDASGAAGYGDALTHQNSYQASVGDTVPLETGNMVGPTVHAVDDIIAADSGSAWNADRNLPQSDTYKIEDGSWMNSPRVVRIPIYDPEIALAQGKTGMTIATFGGFWIESIGRQGTIVGRFVRMGALGSAGPNAGPASGPALKMLRLVE